MSLESALDEERREVLDILEGRPSRPRSPAPARTASPAPPIRSMLDIDSAAPRHGSIAGIGVGITPAPKPAARTKAAAVRSLLDPHSPPPSRPTHSATTSPTPTNTPSNQIHRRSSDAAKHPVDRTRRASDKQAVDPEGDYQFEMLPSIANQALPKRVSQGGKKHNSMAAAITGDFERLPGFTRGRDTGRLISRTGNNKSKSPSSRLGRSQSPANRLLNPNTYNPTPTPGNYVTDSGKVIDLNSAYRRLSDAALLKSGGSLSTMPARNSRSRERLSEGEVMSPTGGIRLEKDYYENQENTEAIETSEDDEEEDDESSGGEGWNSELSRGRRRNRRNKTSGSEGDWEDSDQDSKKAPEGPVGMGRASKTQQVRSLLGAAEEERVQVSSTYKYKSLLDPVVTVTGPKDEKMVTKKKGVHPHTSFDHTASGLNSPATSDSEDLSDIKRAQQLSINMSPVDTSVQNRVIRTILRGDFAQLQREAKEGVRRQRMYLVATDLSDEAVHALEWTIGTILRDGDTLFAVYAVDEEVGTGKAGELDPSQIVQIGEGAKAIQDAAAVVGTLTEKAALNPTSNLVPSPLNPLAYLPATSDSHGGSVDSRAMSKAEQERYHAIEDISQTCVRLLRKTRLQVRVAVEVVHCKSPKHMITEAIDSLEPTLVILGSRGRSALKGVLLGSFSNYLVTKSSVPVMVARKKLKKHAKYKNANIKLSNNLITPQKTLAAAKID